MTPDPQDIHSALRRTVGIAALRQIRRLVDEDTDLENWRARWARRIVAAFAVVGILILAYLASRFLY